MKALTADFPDWFGPMLVKELRQGLKARGFVLTFLTLQIILILVVIYHVVLYAHSPGSYDASSLGYIIWVLIGAQLLLVTPLRALNELAAERKANTLELIFISGLSSWRIVVGKWTSLLFQAILFLLAVLPYAILRYYFGSVNLTEDLQLMALMVLSCASLTAIALAVSGLPIIARVVAAILIVLALMGIVPAVVDFLFLGSYRARGGISSSLSTGGVWLQLANTLLGTWIALEVAAATIAPPAENHAGRQRALSLLLWLPTPFLLWSGAAPEFLAGQMLQFALVVGFLTWHHLAAPPTPLRSVGRPFRGWRAPFGVPFQPGWPSAVAYLGLAVALLYFAIQRIPSGLPAWSRATMFMLAASLLCACSMWVLFRRKAKQPLIEQTVFLVLTGALSSIFLAARESNHHLGDIFAFVVCPPIALFTMHDTTGPDAALEQAWSSLAFVALAAYGAVLLVLSRRYWIYYFQLCRTLGKSSAAPLTPAPLAPLPPRG